MTTRTAPSNRSVRNLFAALAAATCLCVAASPARADYSPTSGNWSVVLFSDHWGNGTAHKWDLSDGTASLSNADLSTISFDNMTASVAICNNTGTDTSFTYAFYQDANYQTSILNSTMTIVSGSCRFYKMISPDTLSSLKVLKW